MGITKEELLKKFNTSKTKEIYVKAWGAKVTIKKLTIAEEDKVQSSLLQDATPEELKDGKIKVKISNAQESNLLRVSYALVKPKMKPAELGALSVEAQKGIDEIIKALDEWDKPKKQKAKS